jgi:hypothetical protein
MKRIRLARAVIALIVLGLALTAPATAAPVKAPGVGFIRSTVKFYGDGDPYGFVTYEGAAGPATGNVLNITVVNQMVVEFTAPLTLLAPSPFGTGDLAFCTYGLGHGTCTIPPAGYYGYTAGCTAQVIGNAGADRITIRSTSATYPLDECGLLFFVVSTKEGNDVIDVHDGLATSVSCGPGADSVTADSSDDVASDCEQVVRR